jgi:hypothetical protein
VFHVIAASIKGISAYYHKVSSNWELSAILCLFFVQIYVNIRCGRCAYWLRLPEVPKDNNHYGMLLFFLIEQFAYVSFIASNTLFLLLRSCCKHKLLVELEVEDYCSIPKIDTILGLKVITDTYVNVVFPFFVGGFTLMLPYPTYGERFYLSGVFWVSNITITLNFLFCTL